MERDVVDEIGKCVACRALVSRDAPPTTIKFSKLPPWYKISLDLYEPLPSGEKLLAFTGFILGHQC